jgi:hypothetical protein
MDGKQHFDARAWLAVLAATAAATLVAACSGDACDELEDRTFRAITEAECGLGPGGGQPQPVMCHWTIGFHLRRFTWNHSDMQESGSYSCDGDTVRGDSDTGPVYTGVYDDTRSVLTWEGREYAPQ